MVNNNSGHSFNPILAITKYGLIKEKLYQARITNRQLASELGIAPTTISLTICGKKKSRRIASHIETRLGVEPGSLFPYLLEKPGRPGRPRMELPHAVNE